METVVKLDFYEFLPGVFFVKTIPIKGLEGDYGVLIKTDEYFLTLDLNLHPRVINQFYQFVDNRHDVHINTHCHIDHIAYLYQYPENTHCQIFAPEPDVQYIRSIAEHVQHMGYVDANLTTYWKQLVINEIGFKECKEAAGFEPGETLIFGSIEIQTIPFPGHNFGHVGFHVILHHLDEPNNSFWFFSDIGVDNDANGKGFGPWYGLPHNSLIQCRQDVINAENMQRNDPTPMVSSHGLYYPTYDPVPYQFAYNQIDKKETRVLDFLKAHGNPTTLADFNSVDIAYKRSKITGAFRKLVDWWETWFVIHQLEDLCERSIVIHDSDGYSLVEESN